MTTTTLRPEMWAWTTPDGDRMVVAERHGDVLSPLQGHGFIHGRVTALGLDGDDACGASWHLVVFPGDVLVIDRSADGWRVSIRDLDGGEKGVVSCAQPALTLTARARPAR